MLQINSMPDHMHIFIEMRPDQSISALIQLVKVESCKWINEHHLCEKHFSWQNGYGAFSYARSQVPAVVRYIANQEAHHTKETFKAEYIRQLNAFEVEWDEKYLFLQPQ